MQWYLSVFKKYAVFRGRAQRQEYWFFVLFNLLFIFGLALINIATTKSIDLQRARNNTTLGIILLIYALVTLLPGLAVTARRLHDVGLSGGLILLSFIITFIGTYSLLTFGTNIRISDESVFISAIIATAFTLFITTLGMGFWGVLAIPSLLFAINNDLTNQILPIIWFIIVFIGPFVLQCLMMRDCERGNNIHGPNPKGQSVDPQEFINGPAAHKMTGEQTIVIAANIPQPMAKTDKNQIPPNPVMAPAYPAQKAPAADAKIFNTNVALPHAQQHFKTPAASVKTASGMARIDEAKRKKLFLLVAVLGVLEIIIIACLILLYLGD